MDIVIIDNDRLSILPDEILEMILRQIEDPPDLASVSRASHVCKRILHPTKSTWQFHEILPQISTYLLKKDLLNCRAVCSKWKNSISNYLETHQSLNFKFSFSPKSNPAITGFCLAMKSHLGNPFPARAVSFRKVTDRRLTASYWIHVFQFLNQFGEYIWNCSFDFGNSRFDLFVIILRRCLAHLKNARRLHISWKFNNDVISEEKMGPDLEVPKFPNLEKLEHVELKGIFSRLFYQKVLIPMYSNQLKTFKIDGIFP